MFERYFHIFRRLLAALQIVKQPFQFNTKILIGGKKYMVSIKMAG